MAVAAPAVLEADDESGGQRTDGSRRRSSSATSSPPRRRCGRWGRSRWSTRSSSSTSYADVKSSKLEQAALRWHGRLELEASLMTLAESQLALAALASLCAGERGAVDLRRKLLRWVKPTAVGEL